MYVLSRTLIIHLRFGEVYVYTHFHVYHAAHQRNVQPCGVHPGRTARCGGNVKAAAESAAESAARSSLSPYQPDVEAVCKELNANISFEGLQLKTKRSTLLPAMLAVAENLYRIYKSAAWGRAWARGVWGCEGMDY